MIDEWTLKQALKHLMLIHYLNSKADDKGLTHGEKHHLHQVIGMEIGEVTNLLNPGDGFFRMNTDKNAIDTSDIPF